LTIDVDATLITTHSEKEGAAGNYKGGYGFHPLQAYLDETREALGGLLRPGNAGANTAEDHKAVLDLALAQIRPSTSRASRFWCARIPLAPRTGWPTTAAKRTCASRSATS
jgi:Transposase DDE domain group 1